MFYIRVFEIKVKTSTKNRFVYKLTLPYLYVDLLMLITSDRKITDANAYVQTLSTCCL